MQPVGTKQFWITKPQLMALGVISLSLAALAFFLGLMVGRGQATGAERIQAPGQVAGSGIYSDEIRDDTLQEMFYHIEKAAHEKAAKRGETTKKVALEFHEALLEDDVKVVVPQSPSGDQGLEAVVVAVDTPKEVLSEVPKTESPKNTVQKKPDPVLMEGWAVQVASFPESKKGLASKQVESLGARGHSAFVVHAIVRGQSWYRVRIGPYATQKDAYVARKALSKTLGKNDLLVTKVR